LAIDGIAHQIRRFGLDHRLGHSTACAPSGRIRWTIPTWGLKPQAIFRCRSAAFIGRNDDQSRRFQWPAGFCRVLACNMVIPIN
jgi:hypothetical protein